VVYAVVDENAAAAASSTEPEYHLDRILVGFEGRMPPGLARLVDGVGFMKVNRGRGETVPQAIARTRRLPG
jgi:hypothetical protein